MPKYSSGPRSNSSTRLSCLAYGIEDAAALSLSRSRLYELIAAGEIGACKVGKRTIIPVMELTAFLDRHRVADLSRHGTAGQRRGPESEVTDAGE